MGVPQEERHMLFDWSNRMIGADDPEYQKEAGTKDGTAAAAELYMYATELRPSAPTSPATTSSPSSSTARSTATS